MATTTINVSLSYDETQSSIHMMHQNSRFHLKFRFTYKHETITTDNLGFQITPSYRTPIPSSFVCSIDPRLVADRNPNSTALLCNDLHSFLNMCDPDLNPRLRLDLARTITHSLKSATTIFPLREVRADVEIIHQQHSWIQFPFPVHHHQQSSMDGRVWIMDGGDLIGEESGAELGGEIGSGASKLGLRKLMKRRFYYRNGAGEEECSICWVKYDEGVEAIKMPCDHVFHQKCILRWLNSKPSCPLCRHTI